MRLCALAMVFVCGCAGVRPAQATTPLPAPEATYESRALPERPDATPVPEADRWVEPAPACRTQDGQTRTGILMSDAQAARAARWVAGYNELRALYLVDQETWARERAVYEDQLDLADREIEEVRARAQRTWWERHGGTVGFVGGIVTGIAAVVGGGVAIERASH